jgi:hypothetical protein
VPLGRVRVRLLPVGPGFSLAEFDLSEADLVSRIDPAQPLARSRTIAHQAAEEAWRLSHVAASPDDRGFLPAYEPQIAAYRATRQPGITIGERAEVIRSSGARSMWRCEARCWVLMDRMPAALVAAVARRRAERASQVRRSGEAPAIVTVHHAAKRLPGPRL